MRPRLTHRDVVAQFLTHQRCVRRGRVGQVHRYRQRVIAHVNRLSRKPRLLQRLSDHGDHRFSDKTNSTHGECMTGRGSRWRAVRAHKACNTGHGLRARSNQISPGDDQQHTGHRQRSLNVD